MGEVSVNIHGREYHIGCQDGQEDHLVKLASYLDGKIKELVESVGNIGDMPLLAMAGILVADELADIRRGEDPGSALGADIQSTLDAERAVTLELVDNTARRIDDIAAALEPV